MPKKPKKECCGRCDEKRKPWLIDCEDCPCHKESPLKTALLRIAEKIDEDNILCRIIKVDENDERIFFEDEISDLLKDI